MKMTSYYGHGHFDDDELFIIILFVVIIIAGLAASVK